MKKALDSQNILSSIKIASSKNRKPMKLSFSSFVNGLTSAAAERWLACREDRSYSADNLAPMGTGSESRYGGLEMKYVVS